MNDRDKMIVQHISRYCDEIYAAIEHFGDSREAFLGDPVYRNAVSMPIEQIGELAKHLSDAFQQQYSEIPWKQIKGMRTWFAHQYLNMDKDVIWEVMHEGIPPLADFCDDLLMQDEPDKTYGPYDTAEEAVAAMLEDD